MHISAKEENIYRSWCKFISEEWANSSNAFNEIPFLYYRHEKVTNIESKTHWCLTSPRNFGGDEGETPSEFVILIFSRIENDKFLSTSYAIKDAIIGMLNVDGIALYDFEDPENSTAIGDDYKLFPLHKTTEEDYMEDGNKQIHIWTIIYDVFSWRTGKNRGG